MSDVTADLHFLEEVAESQGGIWRRLLSRPRGCRYAICVRKSTTFLFQHPHRFASNRTLTRRVRPLHPYRLIPPMSLFSSPHAKRKVPTKYTYPRKLQSEPRSTFSTLLQQWHRLIIAVVSHDWKLSQLPSKPINVMPVRAAVTLITI
jgi:hypothetical protein